MENCLYFNTKRSGYSEDSCGNTITVSDLIEILSQYDGDLPIHFRNDNGYTYGNFTDYDTIISKEEEREEED